MNKYKYARLVVVVLALVVIFAFAVLQKDPASNVVSKCGAYRSDKTISIAGQSFKAEVVTTKKEQATGLSNRPCIEAGQVMMFDFEKPGQYAIWMKEMKFAIDVLWVSSDMEVVGIEKGVEPSTYPDSFANKDQPARYVIEMKSNRSAELKVTLGTKVKIN